MLTKFQSNVTKQSLSMSLLSDEKLDSHLGSLCRLCLQVFLVPELLLHHRPTYRLRFLARSPTALKTRFPRGATDLGSSQVALHVGPEPDPGDQGWADPGTSFSRPLGHKLTSLRKSPGFAGSSVPTFHPRCYHEGHSI